ncbi:MAG: substrate-binding domain-containing protein [Butyricicoccaceae bacterium]
MKAGKKLVALLMVSALLGIAGCSGGGTAQSSQPVEGLDRLGEIQVIAREEGSGTRSTFAQLADFVGDTDKPDLTREDAQIADNAEEVIAAVEKDPSAIGYVSMGALDGTDSVKALSINGTAPNQNHGSYALGRSFYLAYSGKLSELELDFLTYVTGAGQEIVGQSYLPVAKSSTFLSGKQSGSIRICGSTSVGPLMEQLAEEYQKRNPNAEITVEQTDSTDGLTQAMSGACDFGMSSRELKDYETELLDYETIAKDDIVVIVNAENPLNDISLESLKRIYTGETKAWDELN